MTLEAIAEYRSRPTGQEEEEEERNKENNEIIGMDEYACARSIDRRVLKSQDPRHAVKAKTRTKHLD